MTVKSKIFILFTAAVLLCIYMFFANEARKEIYFLCGNYAKGDSFESVERQLNTISLSTYSIDDQTNSKTVVHSSALHLYQARCIIEVDERKLVKAKHYTWF